MSSLPPWAEEIRKDCAEYLREGGDWVDYYGGQAIDAKDLEKLLKALEIAMGALDVCNQNNRTWRMAQW